MNNNYIEQLILNKLNKLSTTETKIAKYFVENIDEITTKTLAQMALDTGISQSSIYNLIVKLGFDGVQDFKIRVATDTAKSNPSNPSERKISIFTDLNPEDSSLEKASKIAQSNILLLEKLVDEIDETQLDKAKSILTNTKLLHFAGQGGSSTLAFNAYHKFIRTPIRCTYNSDFHIQLSNATKFTEDDTIILFSHSGETKETIRLAKSAREYNAKVIVLTGNPFCELIKYADAYFIIYSKESLLQSEALNSQIVYITIIDFLYVSLLLEDKDKSTTSIQNIRKTLE